MGGLNELVNGIDIVIKYFVDNFVGMLILGLFDGLL